MRRTWLNAKYIAVVGLLAMIVFIFQPNPAKPTTGDEDLASKPIYPYDQWPVWSPDGKQLVFSSNRNLFGEKGAPMTLWVVNVDGSGLRQLIPRYGLEYPAWSPNGKFLAFNSGAQIYVFNLDANKAYPLFGVEEHGFYPSWGPDSRTLAFSAQLEEDSDIYIAELDFKAPRILKRVRLVAGLRGADSQPVWSPDGKWIAFVHEGRVGSGLAERSCDEIYIVRPNGTGLKKIIGLVPGHDVERLNWLPDSKQIFISQLRGGVICHITVEDKKPIGIPHLVTGPLELDAYEEIDGKYIVYRHERDKDGNLVYDPQLKIVNVVSGEVTGVQFFYGRKDAPPHPVGAGQIAVSPDGKLIAFMSNSSDYPKTFGTSIWVANLDGSQPREVTKPPQPPDPELPIVARLDPDFPIPMSQRVGKLIELESTIFHPSGWEATKDVQFRFTRTGVKPTSFSIHFERVANVFRLLDAKGEPVGHPVKPSSQGWATLGGVTLIGEKSEVKALKKVVIVHVAFKITDPKLSGEWSIEVRAEGVSGKTAGWQQMGWLNVN